MPLPRRRGRRRPGPENRAMTAKALGRRGNRKKAGKQFCIGIRDDGMGWSRNAAKTARDVALDGIYAARASLGKESAAPAGAAAACKSLALVARAFRTMKTSGLRVRPSHVNSEWRVRARAFLRVLVWRVERSMQERPAPILFEDDGRKAARAASSAPVENAEVSERAPRRPRRGRPTACRSTASGRCPTISAR